MRDSEYWQRRREEADDQDSGKAETAPSLSPVVIPKDNSVSAERPISAFAEQYVQGLKWSASATEYEKTLVIGNIRGFAAAFRKNAEKEVTNLQAAVRAYFEIDPAQDAGAWCKASDDLIRLVTPQDATSDVFQKPDRGSIVRDEPESSECICHKGSLCSLPDCGLYHHKDCAVHRQYHASLPNKGDK